MAVAQHTRSKPRRNPRRMTMADVRAANKRAGHFFFDTSRRGYYGGSRESFRGPYTGPGGTFILSHQSASEEGAPEKFTLYAVKEDGVIRHALYLDGPLGLAVELAKAQASKRPPSLADVLHGLGVRDASVVARRWLQTTQAKIVEDMRSLKLPITVRDWAEMQDITNAYEYTSTADGDYPRAVADAAERYPRAMSYVLDAVIREVEEWLQSQGHVKALKRLGKDAFRDNPRRRAPARRNRTQRPRPAQHRTQHSTRRSARRRTH